MLDQLWVVHEIGRWRLTQLCQQDDRSHEFEHVDDLVFTWSCYGADSEEFEDAAWLTALRIDTEMLIEDLREAVFLQDVGVEEFWLFEGFLDGVVDLVGRLERVWD